MNRILSVVLSAVLVLLPFNGGTAQEQEEGAGDLAKEILSFYLPFVIPKVLQDVTLLREFIRSEGFEGYRTVHGDLMGVDLIFRESLSITWGNRYEALLISTIAVMDHRNFGVRLPVVGPLLWVPLTSEFREEFDQRVQHLPRRIYPDTPDAAGGDRDKLQHFFGSAFLAYLSESRASAERVGMMIEYGESEFILEGVYDERDLRANQHGRSFGLALLAGGDVSPSEFLQLVTAAGAPVVKGGGCALIHGVIQ